MSTEETTSNLIENNLKDLDFRINTLYKAFDCNTKQERLDEVNAELDLPEIWKNPSRAEQLGKERAELSSIINNIKNVISSIGEAQDLLKLALEENDQELLTEINQEVTYIKNSVEKLEFQRMFSDEMDANNAFVDIQAGSGGTEAQDWANMLLRMYLMWSDKHGFKATVYEISYGDVAGIKNATIKIEGEYAYGWLRTESGIHRLVRKSPFNANGKRHTSFSSVFVYPEISDDISVDINLADLRIDTYRSSGAGGQHVNTTDSAIRITHIPTGTVVQCQSERSQHKNKAHAMSQLKAKLYELEVKKQNAEKQSMEENKSDIGWGNQIRSYVLDQSRIKDLRTDVEISSTSKVLDGDLDPFIIASLKSGL
jgi:peptide chain release factor 2